MFDGPNKPPFKRNKRTGPNVASIPEFLAKQLLKQFGFPIHLAPGEAEAECALLQREDIVDAVLSEDVDTLMFGSGITIRNWSPEKSGNTPTHVNVYDAVETKNGPSGLDREGMILVALMSGGDYVPEGIPGCGPKTACEAAKAGFGSDLCKIPTNNSKAMSEWRDRLSHELKTNESKLFKRKHGALKIPDDFPRLDILGYYTHPAISNQTGLDKLRRSINWDQDLDLSGLREFTHDAFDWTKLEGAKHFIRSLAPSLLIRQLRVRAEQQERLPTVDVQTIEEDEALLVNSIHGKRQHPVTDNSTELRVSFTPIGLVKIDLSKEDPDDDFDTLPSGSQVAEADPDDDLPLDLEDEGPKKRGPTKFDPSKPARIWVMETLVKVGVPLKVQDWEAERQTKLKPRRAATAQEPSKAASKAKAGAKRTKKAGDAPQKSINEFAKVTKPGRNLSRVLAKTQDELSESSRSASQPELQPANEGIDLLSSSPIRQKVVSPELLPNRVKSLSPLLQALPASVTKRRRRAPVQRSQTLPTDTSALPARPATPPLLDIIETLDLVDSPILPSPIRLPAKKARTRNRQFSRAPRGTLVASSPGKSKQSTLDTWRASATPTKLRTATPAIDSSPIPAPPGLRPSHDDCDTLDLTLSSPVPPFQDLPPMNPRRVTHPPTMRPPLTSISSNASTISKSSSTSISKTTANRKDVTSSTRPRLSPRLKKTVSAPPETECLDLTSPLPKPARHTVSEADRLDLTDLATTAHKQTPPKMDDLGLSLPQSKSTQEVTPEVDSIDLTELSSPTHESWKKTRTITPPAQALSPEIRRSPRNHKAASPSSPPAAWKTREKKKRQIILRKSVAGSWDYVDVDSPQKLGGVADGIVLKGKVRRKWRESEVEVLDFT